MAELWFPLAPLSDEVVLLRPWREADVPGKLTCGFAREGLLRSHVPSKGARRDSVIYSLLPGELR